MFYQTTTLDRIGWCSSNTRNLDVKYVQPDDEALEDLMEAHEAYMNSEEDGWYGGADGGLYEDYEQSIGE